TQQQNDSDDAHGSTSGRKESGGPPAIAIAARGIRPANLLFAVSSLTTPSMITKRQKELLDYLRTHTQARAYAPTPAQIRRHVCLPPLATVHKPLHNLERKRRIRRVANHSRALELLPEPGIARAVQIPLAGRVAAGTPIEAVEVPETVALPEE